MFIMKGIISINPVRKTQQYFLLKHWYRSPFKDCTGLFISPSGISGGRPGAWARTACPFCSAKAATLLEFMYHSRIVLSVGGSVWYMIQNLRCTVTVDSGLANSKIQNAFLFSVNAIFLHDYPLAVEPGSTPRTLLQKKTWRDSLPIDMLLSAASVLVDAQSSSEIPEGLMNNPVYVRVKLQLIISNLKLIETVVFTFSNSVMKTGQLKLFKDNNCCLLCKSYRL